jgi:hypothetical protein
MIAPNSEVLGLFGGHIRRERHLCQSPIHLEQMDWILDEMTEAIRVLGKLISARTSKTVQL